MADEAGDAASGDIEGEVADRDETAESFSEAMDAENDARRRTRAVADHEPRARPGEAAHEGVKGGTAAGDDFARFRSRHLVRRRRVGRRLRRPRCAGRAPRRLAPASECAVNLLDPGRYPARDEIDDYDETDAERDSEVSRECANEKVGQKNQEDGADRGAPRPARTAEESGDQDLE